MPKCRLFQGRTVLSRRAPRAVRPDDGRLMAAAIDRNAETQSRYRVVNEHIAESYRAFVAGTDGADAAELLELLCECGQVVPCGRRVKVSPATYERVRSDPITFLHFPGHEDITAETMIEPGDGLLVARAAVLARAHLVL